MKFLKKHRQRFIALLNLLLCDEYSVVTFRKDSQNYYSADYSYSFPITDIDHKAIINCYYESLGNEISNRKMEANLEKAKEIIK